MPVGVEPEPAPVDEARLEYTDASFRQYLQSVLNFEASDLIGHENDAVTLMHNLMNCLNPISKSYRSVKTYIEEKIDFESLEVCTRKLLVMSKYLEASNLEWCTPDERVVLTIINSRNCSRLLSLMNALYMHSEKQKVNEEGLQILKRLKQTSTETIKAIRSLAGRVLGTQPDIEHLKTVAKLMDEENAFLSACYIGMKIDQVPREVTPDDFKTGKANKEIWTRFDDLPTIEHLIRDGGSLCVRCNRGLGGQENDGSPVNFYVVDGCQHLTCAACTHLKDDTSQRTFCAKLECRRNSKFRASRKTFMAFKNLGLDRLPATAPN